jgi:hypothetical protein
MAKVVRHVHAGNAPAVDRHCMIYRMQAGRDAWNIAMRRQSKKANVSSDWEITLPKQDLFVRRRIQRR